MEFKRINENGQQGIMLQGDLDEDFDDVLFFTILKAAEAENAPNTPVRIYFSSVETGNSTGMMLFLRVLSKSITRVAYAEVPHWIMIQFNFFRDLILKTVVVESLLADCSVEGENKIETVALRLGTDFPIKKEYDNSPVFFERDGRTYSVQFDPDDLSFISYNFDRFKALNK